MDARRGRLGHPLLNVLALASIGASVALVSLFYVVGKGANDYQRPGPLTFKGTQSVHVTCLSAGSSRHFTDGANVIRYTGEAPLVITKVDLVDGQGLGVVGALVLPVTTTPVGSSAQWPPPKTTLAHALPAEGARMSRHGATQLNLVVHLVRIKADRPVRAAALRIFYTVGDEEWGSVAPLRVGIKSDDGSCQ